MNIERFKKEILLLAEMYPTVELTRTKADIFKQLFIDVDGDVFHDAVMLCIAESTWFPSPAQLQSFVARATPISPTEPTYAPPTRLRVRFHDLCQSAYKDGYADIDAFNALRQMMPPLSELRLTIDRFVRRINGTEMQRQEIEALRLISEHDLNLEVM